MKQNFLISTLLFFAFAVPFSSSSLLAQSATADALFSQAKAEALNTHKNILLVFSASWCGPCKMYEHFLEDPQMKELHEKAFVVVRIDVGEFAQDKKHHDTPGGVELRHSLGAENEPGFPFMVITDASGKPLTNSYIHGDVNKNIGYPNAPEEIIWYGEMLRHGTSLLNSSEESSILQWLKAHAH